MKSTASFIIALVTCPDLRTARRLAKTALGERLAACANLIPALESHYWWKGKLETSREVLVLFKTTTHLASALEKRIIQDHPYETPEFLTIRVHAGNKRYLDWWRDSMR